MKNYTRKYIDEFGSACYYNEKDQFHRIDGPAIEWIDGRKEWYVEGKLHRTDGPAVEHKNGDKEWWVDNEYLDETQFNKLQEIRKLFNDDELLNLLLLEGKLIL